MVASAVEFLLEGLHLTKRLNKEAAGARATYRGSRMTWRFDYRRWDGTQDSLVDDTDSVLSQLTDDLLANGDLHEALQRMLNRGWRTPDGEQVQGLRDLLDQLRLEREEQLDRGDLGGAYREVAEELQEVLAEERTGIDQLEADARGLGRPAPPGGHRRGGRRAPDAARPAARATWPARCGGCRTTSSSPPRPASTSRS